MNEPCEAVSPESGRRCILTADDPHPAGHQSEYDENNVRVVWL